MGSLHYLTVQDILWINLQVAKKVNKFNYATLEEATFYQYAYGESKDVPSQAARFLKGFLKLKPLTELNEATGIIGVISFLHVNGYHFDLEDADGAGWVGSVLADPEQFANRVKLAPHSVHVHNPTVRASIEAVLRAYPLTIAELVRAVAAA